MIWYPYTQMQTMSEPLKIKETNGVYLITEDNLKLIDSISSWWSVIHGYNNYEINEAVKTQIDKFSHVMLGGMTHEPAIKLSEKLKEILPGDLDYVFYSDSGSVAVEVALKMSIQYFVNKGINDKNEFIALTHAYHGDTFKTMSVGDDPDYHGAFPNNSGTYHINTNIDELENILIKHHATIAAFIVEPLLQGAGGMRTYSIEFLKEAKVLCEKYDVLFIFDEVATGFGRTGNMFVSDLVTPDIIVLGKALTGGYIGHAATVANKKVYDAFLSDDAEKALMHGPTFMGNALACSAAIKSLEIFERDNYMGKIANINKLLNNHFTTITSDKIKDVRILGAMACIEVYDSKDLVGFKEFARDNGVFNRPFLNYVYIMPAYTISEEELEQVIKVFKDWFSK